MTDSVETTRRLLESAGYIADAPLATVVHLALAMERPLFLEGDRRRDGAPPGAAAMP